MTENSEPANAYASSAVGGRTDLNFKATATLFLQDCETSEWFDFTLDDKHEKTFVYEPGTFSHDILSFAKLLQSDKIKMGQYSDGQLILEVIGDDGETRRVKLYDKGSLLWLSTRLVDKRVKCNVIACGQENCPTRRRCEKCGKHLGQHKITPNKSQDIGVIALRGGADECTRKRASELCSRTGFAMAQLSTRRLTFNQQLLMGRKKTAKQWLCTVNATGVSEGQVEEMQFQKLSINPPVYEPQGPVHASVLNRMSISEKMAYRETGSTTAENIVVPVNGLEIDAREELDKSSPSEIDSFTDRMDVNEREIKALKKANERFQNAQRKAAVQHSSQNINRDKLIKELRKRLGTPRRGLQSSMVAAKEMDESLFHVRVMHASKARCRHTMDNLPGVIRIENKEWFKKVCKCCMAGDRTHRGGPQSMVRLRTEADKRDALTLEIADTKSYQELLDQELAKCESANANDLNHLQLIDERKRTRDRLLVLAMKLRSKDMQPVLNAIDGVPGLSSASKTRSTITFKDGSGCRFEAPPRPKLKRKPRRGELRSKLISLKLALQPNTKKPFNVNLKFLRAKNKGAKKDRIQILSLRGSTPKSMKRRLTQDANERWFREEGPVTSKTRQSKVTFGPVDDDLAEDQALALNGFTTVRNGVITASPAYSAGMAQIRLDINLIGDMLDLHAVPTPLALMNVRVVSYIDWSPKSVEWIGGIRYVLRMVVPELRLVWSTYHINKGTDDAITGTHQLLDYMANRCGPVSVIRSDVDCFNSKEYKIAMAARGVEVEVHAANDPRGTGAVERYNSIINDLVTKSLLHAKFPEMLSQAFDRHANLILCDYLISPPQHSPPVPALTGRMITPTNLYVMGSEVCFLDANRDKSKSKQSTPRLLGYTAGEMVNHAGIHIFDPVAGKLQQSSPRSFRVFEQVKMREEIPPPILPYAKATGMEGFQAMNFEHCTGFNAYSNGLIKFTELSADEQRKELARRTKKRTQVTAAADKKKNSRATSSTTSTSKSSAQKARKRGQVEETKAIPSELNEQVDPKELIGATIRRNFPGYGIYEGTILSYELRADKPTWYKVRYTDGDEQELTLKQLLTFELDVSATINGSETNAIQVKLNSIQLDQELSGVDLTDWGAIAADEQREINAQKKYYYDNPQELLDESPRPGRPPEPPNYSVVGNRKGRRIIKSLFLRSRGRASSLNEIDCKTRPPDENNFINRKKRRFQSFAKRSVAYQRKVSGANWSRVIKANYIKTIEFDAKKNQMLNVQSEDSAEGDGAERDGNEMTEVQMNEHKARRQFECEVDFEENEDDSWTGDDVAVVAEAMMTRRGKIMSITNETKLNRMLTRGHQLQVNLSKAKSYSNVPDEYNPSAKHVLDPNHPKHSEWVAAMMKEINGLTDTGVMRGEYINEVPAEERRTILHSKLVFKLKVNPTTGAETMKCRLVVRGDRAQEGIHYPGGMECPGSSMSTLKVMCARSVQTRCLMHTFDIAQAYTQSAAPEGFNNRIRSPPGVEKITNDQGDEICYRLISNLYGGPASGAIHWESVKKLAESTGLTSSLNDKTLFSKNTNNHEKFHYFSIYVDDSISCARPQGWHDNFMKSVRNRFKLGLEEVTADFLGCSILQAQWDPKKGRRTQVPEGQNYVVLSNEDAIKRIVLASPVGNGNYYPRSTPIDVDLGARVDDTLPDFIANYLIKTERQLSSEELEDYAQMQRDYEYKSLVPQLAYYARLTRPDISFVVACMQRHLHAVTPSYDAYRALRQCLQYLLGTASYTMTFHESGSKTVDHFVDANFPIGRARMGYCATFMGAAIEHHCKLSACVATSSTEAEIYAACAGLQKAACLRHDLIALGIYKESDLMQFWEDNDSALLNIKGEVKWTSVSRMKHIASKYLKIMESAVPESAQQTSNWGRVDTTLNLSDFFTKALGKKSYEDFRDEIMGRKWLCASNTGTDEANDFLDQVRSGGVRKKRPMSIKRNVAANTAPADTPPTINEVKSNGSSKASRPRLQIRSVRKKRRIEPDCGRQGRTIGARRSGLESRKSTKQERSHLLRANEAQ
jgi:hypothetical protein